MLLNLFSLIILFLVNYSAYGQFSREKITTDTSEIEIIRNSVYRVYEETYKDKDLVWYSVRFIKDSSQVHREGWKTKRGMYIGIWNEYTIDGTLMYTWDHDKGTCVVNKSLFPYYDLLEIMKAKSDSLIKTVYSDDFFTNLTRFNFNSSAHDEEGYVGSWTEPMKRKPTKFIFKYNVRIDSNIWYENMIGIELNENGEYVQNNGIWSNFGFENVSVPEKTFKLKTAIALETAKQNGLPNADTNKVSMFLRWEKISEKDFFCGRFKYYITELIDTIKDIKENARSRVTYKYNVYTFNPWTGDFIEKKRMKRIKEWEKHSGFTSDFMPDE